MSQEKSILEKMQAKLDDMASKMAAQAKENAQLAKILERRQDNDVEDVRAVAGKPRHYRVRHLGEGVTYNLEDDGIDVDGHGVFVRDHGKRQAVVAALGETIANPDGGEPLPVFAFAEKYRPRYQGDPLVYAAHVDDPRAKRSAAVLMEARDKANAKLSLRVETETHVIRTEMQKAKASAGATQ